MEEWRDIPELPSYQASSLGKIRRLETTYTDQWGNSRTLPGSVLNTWKDSDCYPIVRVTRPDKRRVTRTVHGLVIRAFHGPKPSRKQARHLDGNRENNAAANLVWGTAQENHDDKRLHGTQAKGESIHCGKLDEAAVRDIRRRVILWGEKQAKLAREYGVNNHTVRLILLGKTWTHIEDGLTFKPRRQANPGSFGSRFPR